MRKVLGLVLAALVATGAGAGVPDAPDPGSAAPAPAREPAAAERTLYVEAAEDPVKAADGGMPDFSALASHARKSVVSITATTAETTDVEGNPSAREFFERFYGGSEPPTKGMASGFIIHADGYILTNEHVVEDSSALAVVLGEGDGRTYPAQVIGVDDLSDLALIKIDAGRPLPALPLGNSDDLEVGDWVTAIGNPFGLSQSVSVGVVSFLGRRDINPSGRPGYYDFIQTDAAINPGNSGGPLVDRHGRVVGISAAVNSSGQGIGFAIPVNMAKDVLPALYETGSLKRSFMGVSIQDLTADLAESFGVTSGVVVTELTKDGPAQKAGLQVGDVITRFGEHSIEQAYRLRWLASSAGVGAKVPLAYVRDGVAQETRLTLDPLPGAAKTFKRQPAPAPRQELRPLGFDVGPVVNVPGGRGLRVTTVDPASVAYVAGLREGDVVVQVGRKRIGDARELRQEASSSPNGVVRLLIQRGLKPIFVAFRTESPSASGP